MRKIEKKIISVPSATKSVQKSTRKTKSAKKTNLPVKTLTKSLSVRSKSNTLAYYKCLIDQVANPVNEKVKITQLAHHCKCKKGEVEVARQAHKKQLVRKVAQDYLALGENLGHYLHADIVGCAKELKK